MAFARILLLLLVAPAMILAASVATAADDQVPLNQLEDILEVEQQPFVAATERLLQALDLIGSPLTAKDADELRAAMQEENPRRSVLGIQKVLNRYSLAGVRINPESRVTAKEGPAKKELLDSYQTFFGRFSRQTRSTLVPRI